MTSHHWSKIPLAKHPTSYPEVHTALLEQLNNFSHLWTLFRQQKWIVCQPLQQLVPYIWDPNGDMHQEVPAPMVTLVMTVVWTSYLSLNPMLTKLIVILVICHNLWVVHWWTASHRILGQCLSWHLPQTHQHSQSYCRAVRRCIPYDDGWYLCTSKVGTNNCRFLCMIWPDIFAVLLDLGTQWMLVFLLPILIFKLLTKPQCVNECLMDLVSFILK